MKTCVCILVLILAVLEEVISYKLNPQELSRHLGEGPLPRGRPGDMLPQPDQGPGRGRPFGDFGPFIVSKRSVRRIPQPHGVIARDPENRDGREFRPAGPISVACRLCWGIGIVSKRSVPADMPRGRPFGGGYNSRRSIYCRKCNRSGHGMIMS